LKKQPGQDLGKSIYILRMIQSGRQYEAGSGYRYGFNGRRMMLKLWVRVTSRIMDLGFMIRVGEILSVDPLKKKYRSLRLSICSNTPIQAIVWMDWKEVILYRMGYRLGLRVGVSSSGFNYNITASVGVQYGSRNVNLSTFASGSIYGGNQLGTPLIQKDLSLI